MQNAARPTFSPTVQDLAPGGAKSKAGIWLALVIALGVHLLVLLLPIGDKLQESTPSATRIELQLTAFVPAQVTPETILPEPLPEHLPEPLPAPEPIEEPLPEPFDEVLETIASTPPPPTLTPINRDIEQMNQADKTRLTNTILSTQFITRPTAAEQIFGKPLQPQQPDPIAEFHYPQQPNLVAMLDKPMQNLPFEYKQGLVYFAYAPGVKGDLQRFFDDITPEFGWITRYGTEVKCVWVLVIGACAWK